MMQAAGSLGCSSALAPCTWPRLVKVFVRPSKSRSNRVMYPPNGTSAFNPYAPPVVERGGLAGTAQPNYDCEGRDLVVLRGSYLPDICLLTGQPTGGRMRTKELHWIPPWTLVVFLFSRLVGLLCMMSTRKKAYLAFALSAEAETRRKRAVLIGVAVAVIGVAMGFTGVFLLTPGLTESLMSLGFVVFVVGLILAVALRRPYHVRKIVDDRIYLRIKPAAMNAFETYKALYASQDSSG